MILIYVIIGFHAITMHGSEKLIVGLTGGALRIHLNEGLCISPTVNLVRI